MNDDMCKLITLYRTSNENKTIFENQTQRWKYIGNITDVARFLNNSQPQLRI